MAWKQCQYADIWKVASQIQIRIKIQAQPNSTHPVALGRLAFRIFGAILRFVVDQE